MNPSFIWGVVVGVGGVWVWNSVIRPKMAAKSA